MPGLPAAQLVHRPLYYGAMSVSLPPELKDLSDSRPVPDHQECFTNRADDQAFLVEIVEHSSVSDCDCGTFYFADLAEANSALSFRLNMHEPLGAEELPKLTACSYVCIVEGVLTLEATSPSISQQHADVTAHDPALMAASSHAQAGVSRVHVALAVVRLPQAGSDLLVSLSTPLGEDGEGDTLDRVLRLAQFRSMLRTLEVVDWSLFG